METCWSVWLGTFSTDYFTISVSSSGITKLLLYYSYTYCFNSESNLYVYIT